MMFYLVRPAVNLVSRRARLILDGVESIYLHHFPVDYVLRGFFRACPNARYLIWVRHSSVLMPLRQISNITHFIGDPRFFSSSPSDSNIFSRLTVYFPCLTHLLLKRSSLNAISDWSSFRTGQTTITHLCLYLDRYFLQQRFLETHILPLPSRFSLLVIILSSDLSQDEQLLCGQMDSRIVFMDNSISYSKLREQETVVLPKVQRTWDGVKREQDAIWDQAERLMKQRVAA
ncbi:hypothetical protein DL96DRAFT_964021 [Flagelloscypha sp. PMI_526]|nr:hypothetical protein DL96DRAFT_964021 [Flagelloscypha sp. PMI_526]